MNAPVTIHLQPRYSLPFLKAVQRIATRNRDFWNEAATRQTGYQAEGYRNRASNMNCLRIAAIGAQDGMTLNEPELLAESLAELDEYFEHDAELIWRDAIKAGGVS